MAYVNHHIIANTREQFINESKCSLMPYTKLQ